MSPHQNEPLDTITRGTTNPNRLRRCDRWLVHTHRQLLGQGSAVVIDLGFGASPVTTWELAARLTHVPAPTPAHISVIGVEIDPERVAAARAATAARYAPGRLARLGQSAHLHQSRARSAQVQIEFARGGFAVPLPTGCPGASVIRAFNVLRPYPENDVSTAWSTMQARLAPHGIIIDGTCDELGRRMTWVTLDRHRPRSLNIAVDLTAIDTPSDVAERLPKALIHRNVPGEPIHRLLCDWDDAWARCAHCGAFGRRQRFIASAAALRAQGWPLIGDQRRWRLGELAVAWEAVRPNP